MNEYVLMVFNSLFSFVLTVAGFVGQTKILFRIMLVVSFLGVVSSSLMWYTDKLDAAEDKSCIAKQGKTIEFLRDIAPLPERKLLEVRKVIEANLSIRLNLHYGWWFYDQRKELLKYTFTDSARTNFAGAAYVRRDILESVIGEPNDPIVISNLFNWICHKPIKELSGKSGILLQQDEIEIISDLIDTMLVVMSLGYDRANSSHYLKFKFFSGYDRSGAHIWKDAWLTREEVEKLSCCSIYIASKRLYEMLKSKGIDAPRFKAGGWTDYCINI